jgi:predicted transcriptional regulator
MFLKTTRMLRDAGIDPRAVPPRLFLPIVENASVQDDDDLHTRWAALLANAATTPNLVHPSYIEVLRQLSPKDAELLDKLYDSCVSKGNRSVQRWDRSISLAERDRRTAAGENPEEQFQNLTRLGLIATEYDLNANKIKVKMPRGGVAGVLSGGAQVNAKLDTYDYLTDFAMRFVQACRAPAVTIEGKDQSSETH